MDFAARLKSAEREVMPERSLCLLSIEDNSDEQDLDGFEHVHVGNEAMVDHLANRLGVRSCRIGRGQWRHVHITYRRVRCDYGQTWPFHCKVSHPIRRY